MKIILKLRTSQIVLGTIAVAALFFAIASADFRLSPYVSFAEARSGNNVQIFGSLEEGSPVYGECSVFVLRDDGGELMRVEYCGTLAHDFSHIRQLAALGHYDAGNNVFRAYRLLFKCPTKYERQ